VHGKAGWFGLIKTKTRERRPPAQSHHYITEGHDRGWDAMDKGLLAWKVSTCQRGFKR
jgi:hypothetical protein